MTADLPQERSVGDDQEEAGSPGGATTRSSVLTTGRHANADPSSRHPRWGDDTGTLPRRRRGVPEDDIAAAAQDERPRRTGPAGRILGLLAAVERGRIHLFGLAQPEPAWPAPARARWLFGVSVVFYAVFELLTRGRMILGGSMWAEMGTNYYPSSASASLATRLFATDAGYVPLPQRLIGLIGHAVGVPVSAVPYFFTGSALLLSGLILGSVCLPAFRSVIGSDGLRFVLALALMLLPDFESRTFINFTYFGVVFIAFVTALALVRRDQHVPAWAWFVPVLMVSKPGVLAVFPAMVVVGIISRGRFRRIVVVSVLAGIAQLIRLATSASSGGSLLQSSQESAFTKLYATVKYSLGLLGRLVLGPAQDLGVRPWMLLGAGIVVLCAAAMVLLRSRALGIVLIGLSLIFFGMMIDCLTFSAVFTPKMTMLPVPGLDRRYLVGLIGVLFVVAGLVAAVLESSRIRDLVGRLLPRVRRRTVGRGLAAAGVGVFAAWFLAANWMDYTAAINQPLGLPVGDVSQWSEMSPVLASGEPIVCVPLDPFGWMYGRNCSVLADSNITPAVFGWATPTDSVDGRTAVTVRVPAAVGRAGLASFALMVRPPAGGDRQVTADAVVTQQDGSTAQLHASADLRVSGGLMQFSQESPVVPIHHASKVTLVFDTPVTVGSAHSEDAGAAILLWMGQPGG